MYSSFEFACNKTTPTTENVGEPQQRREVTTMGSADVMAWLAEGYLAGDPIRYPLYVGSMFLAMPFQLIGVILGHRQPDELPHQSRPGVIDGR